MTKRDPVPKIYARQLKPTLVFDIRDEEEIECLRWIRKAPHGEMTKRLMRLVLLGYKAHKDNQKPK